MNNDENQIYVFTHTDLDGVCSYLVLCWVYGKKLNVIGTTPRTLEQDFLQFKSKHETWEKLYFLDLDVSKIGHLIDHKNTLIFDHHKTNIYQYKNAITKIYNETSCAKLLYNTFFNNELINKKLTKAQKMLVALADDWDSHSNSTPMSKKLNIVYHSMSNKFNSFVEDYYNGFRSFDKFKENIVLLYNKHEAEYLNTLTPFFGSIEFQDEKDVKVGAVFCNKFVQECCDWMFSKFDVDVAIAVMVEQKRIAVRRSPRNQTIDVSQLVQRISSGGGHAAAAGGELTEPFIMFTKQLRTL